MSRIPNWKPPSKDRPADLCTFCELFADDPDPLYNLALLLTTGHQTAEQRFFLPEIAFHRPLEFQGRQWSIQALWVGGVL